jgi:SAM-dependent methyltransferase
VGGTGLHAVKFLLAGASSATTVTPFLREAVLADELARRYGVGDRHLAVVGLGEELPFRSGAFDRVYCGGSLHHLDGSLALPELARVLGDDGRFASIDTWRTPVYGLGIRLFGKRERGVNCRPLDPGRLAGLWAAFRCSEVTRFHPVARYPLILQQRLPRHLHTATTRRLLALETEVERRLPRPWRGHGSCVAVTAAKAPR